MKTRLMFPVFMAVGLVVLILASTSNAHAIGLLNIGHGCDGKTKCDAKAKPKCGAEPKAKCGAEPKCGAKKKCGCSAA